MALLRQRRGERRAGRPRRTGDRRNDWIERGLALFNTLAILYVLFVLTPAQTHRIVVNRESTTGAFCQFENESRKALRVLIVGSTVLSKHVQYPGPDYPHRVVQAEVYAKTLAPGDCARLQELVASREKFQRVPLLTVDPKELAPLHTP